jgi:PAS domain S-box-containing protein
VDRATNRILDHTLLGEAMLMSGVAVLVTDDDRNYVAVNDAAERLTGYTREEFRRLHETEVSVGLPDAPTRWLEGTVRLRRKDGVVGEIRYIAFHAEVGAMQVLVRITRPIDEFAPV